MKEPIVLIGVGEMGAVFARGFLRTGHPVYPVGRDVNMEQAAGQFPEPALVLVAAGEGDVPTIMQQLPSRWRRRLGLLQNELLPGDWERHDYREPTVISVWFEKKKGQDVKVIIPSPVYGPGAAIIDRALRSIHIPARILDDKDQLVQELVLKNVYILTTNICGLVTGGTVDELWSNHQDLARTVANEVMDLQSWLTGASLDRAALIQGMVEAFQGDPAHKCMGRSAAARLERALKLADEAGLKVPRMREIQADPEA